MGGLLFGFFNPYFVGLERRLLASVRWTVPVTSANTGHYNNFVLSLREDKMHIESNRGFSVEKRVQQGFLRTSIVCWVGFTHIVNLNKLPQHQIHGAAVNFLKYCNLLLFPIQNSTDQHSSNADHKITTGIQ